MPPGAHGEEWRVLGGGFHHILKYLVAPERIPEHLTWFRRESHATWLSGFALLAIVYRAGAELFLIDRTVAVLAPLPVIAITLASEIIEWYRAAVASWALSNLRRRRLRSVSGSLDQKA